MRKYHAGLLLCFTLLFASWGAVPAAAHDTWVQTNTDRVRVGHAVHVDLMLGNHGNHHRDFKLMGKVDIDHATLTLVGPDAQAHDLTPELVDMGHAPGEGFWSAWVQPTQAGLYSVVHTYDRVVHYAPLRSIKSAKAFFVASENLDDAPASLPGYDRVLGHPLELVPQTSPVAPMGAGAPITVQLLYDGEPLANARVSFIPRGRELAHPFDERYERHTDEQGLASFEPTEATYHLIVAHHEAPERNGEGYNATKYSATLTLYVPVIHGGD